MFPTSTDIRLHGTVARKQGEAMWIAIEGAKHKSYVDASKLDSIEVAYVSNGNYKIVGVTTMGRELALVVNIGSQKAAYDTLDDLIKNLMS